MDRKKLAYYAFVGLFGLLIGTTLNSNMINESVVCAQINDCGCDNVNSYGCTKGKPTPAPTPTPKPGKSHFAPVPLPEIKKGDNYRANMLEAISTKVDPINERNTNTIIYEIGGTAIDKFDANFLESVHQVVSDNIAQARALELAGEEPAKVKVPQDRARDIVEKLSDKVLADCGKGKTPMRTVFYVTRLFALLGGSTPPEQLHRCTARTAIARNTFGSLTYEARKCIPLGETGRIGRIDYIGDWKIKVTGDMKGEGLGSINSEGSGGWDGQIFMEFLGEKIDINMSGPFELVSGGGQCALKITAGAVEGVVGLNSASAAGKGGLLPIKIVDEVCLDDQEK